MIERPVILLMFANQQDAYLKNLKQETLVFLTDEIERLV